jgi:hypothetical protein
MLAIGRSTPSLGYWTRDLRQMPFGAQPFGAQPHGATA